MGGVVLDHSGDVVSRQISLNPEHPNSKSVISPQIGPDMLVSASIYLSIQCPKPLSSYRNTNKSGVQGLRGFWVKGLCCGCDLCGFRDHLFDATSPALPGMPFTLELMVTQDKPILNDTKFRSVEVRGFRG